MRGKRGAELGRFDVGLGKPFVRKTFSDEFTASMDDNKDWLANLIAFRDGLAHRIPLYIAPYVIEESSEQHKTIDIAAVAAAVAGDPADYVRLRLTTAPSRFPPWMTHSVCEGASTILFHKQVQHDYATIDAYGWALPEKFDR